MSPVIHREAATAAPIPSRLPQAGWSRDAQRLGVEHAVAETLSRAADLPRAGAAIVQAVCSGLGWQCGGCWIDSADEAAPVFVGTWDGGDSLAGSFLREAARRAPPQGASGLMPAVRATGEPTWTGATQTGAIAEVLRNEARRAGLAAALAFPIVHAGRTLGVVEVFGGAEATLDEGWLECLRYVGSQIGQFQVRVQAEAALRESERRHADTIELAAIGIAHVDETGRLTHANRWLCELLGYRREELLALTVKQISHPDDRNLTDGVRARLRAGEINSFQAEKRYLRKDGTPVWVQLTISVQRNLQGEPLHDIAIIQNISARKQAEAALQRSEQRFRSLVELSSDWVWELDVDLRLAGFGGRPLSERQKRLLSGRRPWEIAGVDQSAAWAELRGRLQRHEPFRDFEYGLDDGNGGRLFISASGEPQFDDDARFCGYRGVSRDITLRKRTEEHIRFLATHDSLTGLPNRAMFTGLLQHVIEHARRQGRPFALLFIDLDHFKSVNDSLGHEAGDELLRTVARRLSEGLRSSDIVARLGGDEFVMLLRDSGEAAEAEAVAHKLLAALNQPVELCGQALRITASIGISVYLDDALDEMALMSHADTAMYQAKSQGRNSVRFHARPPAPVGAPGAPDA